MGWHASDTGELAFQDVFVPDENLLGEENKGFYLIMANFQWERLLMALGAVGSMQQVLEKTIAYALERKAFGRADRPASRRIRHKLAEMALKLETGRAMTYHALRLFHEGHDAIREVTMAKLATQRAAFEVADDALQIHGGAGYMKEYEIERAGARHAPGPDRRRHRRDHEGDPGEADRAVALRRGRAEPAAARLEEACLLALELARVEHARCTELAKSFQGLEPVLTACGGFVAACFAAPPPAPGREPGADLLGDCSMLASGYSRAVCRRSAERPRPAGRSAPIPAALASSRESGPKPTAAAR